MGNNRKIQFEIDEEVEVRTDIEGELWALRGVIKRLDEHTVWLRIPNYVGLLPRELSDIRKIVRRD